MYPPKKYQITDINVLHQFIERYSFATLIAQQDGKIEISHVPLLLERRDENQDYLIGHITKNNPQYAMLNAGCSVTAIFHGPHGYISPGWYKDNFTAPTWDYAVVHVQGHATLIQEKQRLEALLEDLINKYESTRAQPWQFDWTDPRKEKLLAAISGIEIKITHLVGRFKLSQDEDNQTKQDIIKALADNADTESLALANFLQDYYVNKLNK